MLKYSVLMSVYAGDNPNYFEAAVESMLEQTVLPEQIVIVADGPVSEEIQKKLDNYAENRELFTIVAMKENKGLANALNQGLENCRNELIARMDADDISLPMRCEKELKRFEENAELVICGCNIDEFYKTPDNVRTSRIVPSEYIDILKFARRRQPFNHPTVMYKKSKVIECGRYPDLKRKEDFDLFSRMLAAGCYAENIDESLYLYRADDDNYARRKSWVNVKSAIEVYRKHMDRKSCTIIDFCIVTGAEILFYIIPVKWMKFLSDHLLRRKAVV